MSPASGARWAEKHADGIALAIAVVAGFLFCLGAVYIGIEWMGFGR